MSATIRKHTSNPQLLSPSYVSGSLWVRSSVVAKSPGTTYCINGVCHRVQTIGEVRASIGLEETVRASFYDDCKVDADNPCTALSSGEKFQPGRADNAASPVYPNGTVLIVTNPMTNRSERVRINNSGPYFKGRMLDVSRATAELLGFIEAGTAQLKVKAVEAPLGNFEVLGSPVRR